MVNIYMKEAVNNVVMDANLVNLEQNVKNVKKDYCYTLVHV